MTCLTVTPDVVDEAIAQKADLIVAHHPLPFKAVPRITTYSIVGAMLLRLIGGGIAVYSAHTAFDSARDGINQMWATLLGLEEIRPLVVADATAVIESTADAEAPDGAGRFGRLQQPERLDQLVRRAADAVGASSPRHVGQASRTVTKVALACGSGGSFLAAAKRCGCDAMITGEATFHNCLEAAASEIGLGLLGHYPSERFAMERLAESLQAEFPDASVWPSRREHDPIVGLAAAKHE